VSARGELGLSELLAIDGYDTPASIIDKAAWLDHVGSLIARLGITLEYDVCEIGCGAGAFLLPLYDRGIRVWGADYAKSMIAICTKVMRRGNFVIAEACSLPYASKAFDVVLADSLAIYFPDLAYAEAAVAEIARVLKPGGRAALLDINDARQQELYVAIKRERLGAEAFEAAYKTCKHLFYEREWFFKVSDKNNLTCVVEDQAIAGYANAPFRFNVFFEKD